MREREWLAADQTRREAAEQTRKGQNRQQREHKTEETRRIREEQTRLRAANWERRRVARKEAWQARKRQARKTRAVRLAWVMGLGIVAASIVAVGIVLATSSGSRTAKRTPSHGVTSSPSSNSALPATDDKGYIEGPADYTDHGLHIDLDETKAARPVSTSGGETLAVVPKSIEQQPFTPFPPNNLVGPVTWATRSMVALLRDFLVWRHRRLDGIGTVPLVDRFD